MVNSPRRSGLHIWPAAAFLAWAMLLAACQPATAPAEATAIVVGAAVTEDAADVGGTATVDSAVGEAVAEKGEVISEDEAGRPRFGVTNQRLDGNRVVEGYTDLSRITPIDVELRGIPAWVASVSTDLGVLWGVVLEDGRTQAVLVEGGRVTHVATEPERLPAGMPPLLAYENGIARFVISDSAHDEISPYTNAVPVGDALIGVEADGDLFLDEGETTQTLDTDALIDARLLVDDAERVLFVSQPTTRYRHGVLGDTVEAAQITLAEIEPVPRIVRTVEIPSSLALEGIAPLWADLEGDDDREIVATLSDDLGGARVVVYAEDGAVIAEGQPIGQGNRWLHTIAIASFGPHGELELAVVLTPHIGGVVEFYELADGKLDIVAGLPGFTSHVLGSRNLDMALAASPDEGQAVLLAPSQDRSRIGAIRRDEDGAETVWQVDVDGLMVTNLGAASLGDDRIGVSVGRADGSLRIWQPD